MKNILRIVTICFTLFILNVFVAFAGQERSVESVGYTITFPGTMYIMTDDASRENPYYEKFDLDYDEFNSYLDENRIDIYGIDPNFHYEAAVSSAQEGEYPNFFTMSNEEMDAYVTAYRTEANNNRMNLVFASWMALDSGLKYVEVIYIQNGTRNYTFFTSNGQAFINVDFIRSQECYLEETYYLDIIKKTAFENPIPAEKSAPTLASVAETYENIDNTTDDTSFTKDAIANEILKVVGILIVIAVFLLFRGGLGKKQTAKSGNGNKTINDPDYKTETVKRISPKPRSLNSNDKEKPLKDSLLVEEATFDLMAYHNNILPDSFTEADEQVIAKGQARRDIITSNERPNDTDYGYSEHNPICTSSIKETERYLQRLRSALLPNGAKCPIRCIRNGSVSISKCNGADKVILDIYEVTVPAFKPVILYFCPYAHSTYHVPRNFQLLNENDPNLKSPNIVRNNSVIKVYAENQLHFGDNREGVIKEPENIKNNMPVVETIEKKEEIQTVGKKEEVLYCRKCGRKIPSDSDFCQFCGTPVKHE